MKLRNLLFGTMVALAFTACSDDNDPVVTPDPTVEGNALLNVKIQNIQTKAGEEINDETISNLTVFVFNTTTGDIEAIGTNHLNGENTDPAADEVVNISVTAGNKDIIVVANIPSSKTISMETVSNKTDLEGLKVDLAGEENGMLSMNSEYFTASLLPNRVNCLGYSATEVNAIENGNYLAPSGNVMRNRVPLYRNVARVKLAGLVKNIDQKQYPEGDFTAEEVFILHSSQSSLLVGKNGGAWATTWDNGKFYNGVANGPSTAFNTYGDWVTYMTTETVIEPEEDGDEPTVLTPTAIKKFIANSANYAKLGDLYKEYDSEADLSFYVYENGAGPELGTDEYHTLLVVGGTFTWKGTKAVEEDGKIVTDEDGNVEMEEVTIEEYRYYPVAIGIDGFYKVVEDKVTDEFVGFKPANSFFGIAERDDAGYYDATAKTFAGVLRNLQYNVTLTISGIGYKTPFGPPTTDPEPGPGPGPGPGSTVLNVAVDVVDFGEVTQGHEIKE